MTCSQTTSQHQELARPREHLQDTSKAHCATEETTSIQQLYSGLHELPVLEVRDLVAEAALEAVRRVLGPVAVEDLDMPAAGLRALGSRRRRDVRY